LVRIGDYQEEVVIPLQSWVPSIVGINLDYDGTTQPVSTLTNPALMQQ
jgi:hypothetical protein